MTPDLVDRILRPLAALLLFFNKHQLLVNNLELVKLLGLEKRLRRSEILKRVGAKPHKSRNFFQLLAVVKIVDTNVLLVKVHQLAGLVKKLLQPPGTSTESYEKEKHTPYLNSRDLRYEQRDGLLDLRGTNDLDEERAQLNRRSSLVVRRGDTTATNQGASAIPINFHNSIRREKGEKKRKVQANQE